VVVSAKIELGQVVEIGGEAGFVVQRNSELCESRVNRFH